MDLGAIYAFIPIVIIIILIAAAAGLSRGTDIFQLFGIGALIGIGSGIGKGGVGRTIGSAGRSYGSPRDFKGMGIGTAKAIKGRSGNNAFKKAAADKRARIINNFQTAARTGKIGDVALSDKERAALAAANAATLYKAKAHGEATGRLSSAQSKLTQHVNMAVVPGAMAPKQHGFIYGRAASAKNPNLFSKEKVGSYVSPKKQYNVGRFRTWLYGGKEVASGQKPRTTISLGPASTIYGIGTSFMSLLSKERLGRPADPNAFGSARWGRVRQEALQKQIEREGKPFAKEVERAQKNVEYTSKEYHRAIQAELQKTSEGREVLRKLNIASSPGYEVRASMPPPPQGRYAAKEISAGFGSYYAGLPRRVRSNFSRRVMGKERKAS